MSLLGVLYGSVGRGPHQLDEVESISMASSKLSPAKLTSHIGNDWVVGVINQKQ